MGLSMIFIIMSHQPFLLSVPFKIFHFLGHFGVDAFFFLSGLGCYYSLNKRKTIDFYKRRLIRLIPIIVFCGTAKYLLTYSGLFPFSEQDLGAEAIFGFDLWFFRPLVTYYLLSPLLMHILKDYPLAKILILLYSMSLIGIYIDCLGIYFSWGMSRLPSFVIGMMIGMGKLTISESMKKYSILLLILALAFRVFALKYLSSADELITYLILSFSISYICLYSTKLVSAFRSLKLYGIIEITGLMTLELYLWHEYIFHSFILFDLPPVVSFVFALIVSYALAFMSKKIVDLVFKMQRT